MQKRISAQEEMHDQMQHQKMPEMKAKMRECQEAEEQLRDIEGKLGKDPEMQSLQLAVNEIHVASNSAHAL